MELVFATVKGVRPGGLDEHEGLDVWRELSGTEFHPYIGENPEESH